MRKNIIMLMSAITLLAGSLSAQAEHRDYRWGVDSNRHSPYYYNKRYHPGPYHHGHNRGRSSKDEWAYALGGLVLGAVIANSASRNRAPERQEEQVYLPPRPKRKVQVCEDVVAYDNAGKPYVMRQCVVTEQ